MTIEVSALKSATPAADSGSFTNRFDVEVQTDAAVYTGRPQDTIISTANQASGIATISGTANGAFETGTGRFGGADYIRILPSSRGDAGGNRRPVAGTYTGYVRMTATAN